MSASCASADRSAFDAVHVRFGPGLRAVFARRAGEARTDLLDDLCQRTWMMTWQAILAGKYDPQRSAISTFIYAVANNVWLRHLRSLGRSTLNGRAAQLEELEQVMGRSPGGADERDDPAHAAAFAEELQAMRLALGAGGGSGAGEGGIDVLTRDEREIVLGAARGESDRDLAARLGFAPSTINGKKQSGLEKLRRLVRRSLDGRTRAEALAPPHTETNA